MTGLFLLEQTLTISFRVCIETSFRYHASSSCSPKAVEAPASGISDSHGVTGGVYKTRERIHRDILIRDY